MDKQRVMEVWLSAGRVGTGYLVADDLILTAYHNVHADGPAGSIEVRPLGDVAWVRAERIWPAQASNPAPPPGADAALVRITDESWRPRSGSAPVRWGRVAGQDRIPCLAVGFPDAEQHARTRDTKEIRGHVETLTGIKSGLITVYVDQSAVPSAFDGGSGWSGSSGAALFCGQLLIGVLTIDRSGAYAANQLTAVPIAELAKRPEFERALQDAGVDLIIEDTAPPSSLPPRGAPWLRKAAEDLADRVEKQWQEEEERRQVHHPFPLAVRFQPAETGLFDHWANIRKAPPGTDPGPLLLTGRLDQILKVHRSIPTRRLVVLGAAGSGKTVLTLRFVLDWLGDRAPGDPVPVIFGLGSWDPTISLRDWMCDQLVRDYAGLAAPAPAAHGGNLAGALVDAGWILPVLDGFDEIASGLQRKALIVLNRTTTALLLTSRPEEYTEAVKQTGVLTGAAVVKLDDLTLDDLANYLPRASRPGSEGGLHSTAWEPVLAELRRQSPSPGAVNLTTALTTPLMVALARLVYRGAPERDPAELLDTAQFATPEALRGHLLAAFTPAAYADQSPNGRGTSRRRQWHRNPDRAQHWLSYLAAHLKQLNTSDLAWWQLGTTMRRSSRILVVGFLAALAFGVTTGVGNVPVDLVATSHGLKFALVRGLVVGLLHGLVVGLAFGYAYGFVSRDAVEPSRVRVQIFGRTRKGRARFAPRFMIGLKLGLPVALAMVLVDRFVVERVGLGDGLDGGLVGAIVFVPGVGAGVGLVAGLMAWLEVPIDTEYAASPSYLLDINRKNVLFHMLVWALVFGFPAVFAPSPLSTGIITGPVSGLLIGLVIGLEAAFGGGLGYGLSFTAWGQWVALSRIWLPLTGRLPWALIAFLDDACERGVLRQAGAVYQFRHAQLQDHLAQVFQEARGTRRRPTGTHCP